MRALTANHLVAVAKAILDSADFCFLITQGEGGGSSARLMQHVKPDADLTLWFGTSISSRKVREIRSTPRATVTCLDPQRPAYAALAGAVTIDEHIERWRRYWRDDWKTFWPEGPSARDYVLLRFTCERVEVLSLAAGIAPPPYGLHAAVALRRDGGWQLEHG
jgi:general stress protein 26